MPEPSTTLPSTEIVFFDGFDDLDAIAPLEILHGAGFPIRAVAVAGSPRTVSSAHGLQIEITESLSRSPGLVVLPGGGWRDGSPVGVRAQCRGALPRRLAELHDGGTVLASVCTGAMLLAAAGLLRARPAVTNRIALDDLGAAGAEVKPGARVVDAGLVITCGGPAAGLDLALHLVERFRGADVAAIAAERLEHERVGQVLVA